ARAARAAPGFAGTGTRARTSPRAALIAAPEPRPVRTGPAPHDRCTGAASRADCPAAAPCAMASGAAPFSVTVGDLMRSLVILTVLTVLAASAHADPLPPTVALPVP